MNYFPTELPGFLIPAPDECELVSALLGITLPKVVKLREIRKAIPS